MKTLAVIKNELFKDYLRFVSTSDLPSVLDNPDIPVPFTCLESVENGNSDALMEQLKAYFNRYKVGNKDFYTLDDDNVAQLQFMFNLIKLSSGQSVSATPVVAPVTQKVEVTPVSQPEPVVEVTQPVVEQKVEVTPVSQPESVVEVTKDVSQVEMIESLGIAKGAVVHFLKSNEITATLIDDKTLDFDGQKMTLVEAAKAAFKKSGTVGMAVGFSNWLYEGETLKAWKEKQLN